MDCRNSERNWNVQRELKSFFHHSYFLTAVWSCYIADGYWVDASKTLKRNFGKLDLYFRIVFYDSLYHAESFFFQTQLAPTSKKFLFLSFYHIRLPCTIWYKEIHSPWQTIDFQESIFLTSRLTSILLKYWRGFI